MDRSRRSGAHAPATSSGTAEKGKKVMPGSDYHDPAPGCCAPDFPDATPPDLRADVTDLCRTVGRAAAALLRARNQLEQLARSLDPEDMPYFCPACRARTVTELRQQIDNGLYVSAWLLSAYPELRQSAA